MKKAILVYIVTIHFILAGTYSGGKGTTVDPYKISSANDLIELSQTPKDWDKNFIQTKQVEFNQSPELEDWNRDGVIDAIDDLGFSPIGSSGKKKSSFTGTYNGQLFKITNLYINRQSVEFVGLFGSTSKATIKNIRLNNVHILGKNKIGALVGMSKDDTIDQVVIDSGNVSGQDQVGGLIGYTENSTVNFSKFSGEVSGNNNVGGLIGDAQKNKTVISNSITLGLVSGNDSVGGIFGNADKISGQNLKTGTKSVGNQDIGGLVGKSNDCNYDGIFCKGVTSGNYHVGAIVGHLNKAGSHNNLNYTEERKPIGNQDGDILPPSEPLTVLYTNSPLDDEIIGQPPTDTNNYIETEPLIVRGSGSMVRTDYIFWGWKVVSENSMMTRKIKQNEVIFPGDTFIMPKRDVTFISHWVAPPTITFEDGVDNVHLEIPINELEPIAVTATDLDSPTLAYSISGGDDADLFKISESDGILEFLTPPDYHQDGNNHYQVEVTVADELNLTDTQTIN